MATIEQRVAALESAVFDRSAPSTPPPPPPKVPDGNSCGHGCSWGTRGPTKVRSDHMNSEDFLRLVEAAGGHLHAAGAMILYINELEDRRVGAVELTEEMARRLRKAADDRKPPEPAAKACERCPVCKGVGVAYYGDCRECHGTGRTAETSESDATDGKPDRGSGNRSPETTTQHAARGQRSEEPRSPSGDSPAAPDVEAMVRWHVVPHERVWRGVRQLEDVWIDLEYTDGTTHIIPVDDGNINGVTNRDLAVSRVSELRGWIAGHVDAAARRARVEALEEAAKECAAEEARRGPPAADCAARLRALAARVK